MSEEIKFEEDKDLDLIDPDQTSPDHRDVFTQNYDLVIGSLIDQINSKDIVLRPSFQRGYVWSNKMASRLIESVILNVPIPPCYLAQNDEFELDVVDGQQRLESIRRYVNNEFSLSSLSVATELNGLRFHKLSSRIQRQIKTHTMRCVMITNKSHPDIKFDIFERLNTITASLNSQELRNCLYMSSFNDFLREAASDSKWLSILKRKVPDKRMAGEEMILRYFSFQNMGINSYRTPMKNWLNDGAKWGRGLDDDAVEQLKTQWVNMLNVSLAIFDADNCYRRPGSRVINKALFDLVAVSASKMTFDFAINNRERFITDFTSLMSDDEFEDLISRAVDHKKRTLRRFELWNNKFNWL